MKDGRIKQQMNTIDVLKLVFAICVVAIHTELSKILPNNIDWAIMHLVFRLAVPFFFVSSGFFLGIKLQENQKKREEIFSSYRKRLLPPLLFWGGLGLIIYSMELIMNGTDILGVLLRIVRTAIFYPKGAMWFVAACIVGSLILEYVIKKKYSERIVTIVAILLFTFALFANTYYFLIEGTIVQVVIDLYIRVCVSARNGVFLFIYLWLGFSLSNNKVQDCLARNRKWTRLLLLLSILTLILEVYLTFGKHVLDDSSLFVSYIVLVPLIVHEATSYQMPLKLPYKDMRNLSTVLYYVHPPLSSLLKIFFNFNGLWQFIIVFACCIGVYFATRKISNNFIRKII